MAKADVKKTTEFKMAWAKIVARAAFDPAFCQSLQNNPAAAFEMYGVQVPEDVDLNAGVEPTLDEAMGAISQAAQAGPAASGGHPGYAASMMSPFGGAPSASAQFSCFQPQFSCFQPQPQFSCFQPQPQFSCFQPQFSCFVPQAQPQFSCFQPQFSCFMPAPQFSCFVQSQAQPQFSCFVPPSQPQPQFSCF